MMVRKYITAIKRRLGIIPKDFSVGGYDYNRMMASNHARTEESGINNSSDIKQLLDDGVDAFLIGELFMRQEDIASKLKELKSI